MPHNPTATKSAALHTVPSSLRSRKFEVFTRGGIDRIPQLAARPREERDELKALSVVFPFRVNNYVLEDLIDWSEVPDDPIYQLTFPQPGMLDEHELSNLVRLVRRGAPLERLKGVARQIQSRLNPHPAGQLDLNVPWLKDEPLEGMQHKYRETVLFFPAAGQTCHAYCSYCFRWAQFVGVDELKFAALQTEKLVSYLKRHREVTSVLLTGGDPMVMKSSVLRRYVEPLLDPELEHVTSIRIGTKSPAYWPYRYVTDPDADDLLRLFDRVRRSGKHLAVMAHYSHPRELDPPIAQAAVRRIKGTGAVVRCQAPLIRHVNDSADSWAELWERQIAVGAVPYYMFVERNTGAKKYFDVPLVEALEIFNEAYRNVSGLARTVRGPSMSALPGKMMMDGVAEVAGEKVFVLQFLQGRNPDWVGRPFFAKYDPEATWWNELRPAFGEKEFFFERDLRGIKNAVR